MDSKPASTQPENPPSENSQVLEKDSRTTAVYHTVYCPRTVCRVTPEIASVHLQAEHFVDAPDPSFIHFGLSRWMKIWLENDTPSSLRRIVLDGSVDPHSKPQRDETPCP